MIQHCLRRPGAPVQDGATSPAAYEQAVQKSVGAQLKKVVAKVGPKQLVQIAVDGVVPMAKIRQQRLRRFKSPWIAEQEAACGKPSSGPRWDTNAITPGTAFMEELAKQLEGLCKQEGASGGVKWIVSSAEEKGEGEHKIMQQLRGMGGALGSHVVQGLDADLILLCLLQMREQNSEMFLFRENIEGGEVQQRGEEEEQSQFNLGVLRKTILKELRHCPEGADPILEQAMAMTLLGNDFVPHSVTLKLQDGGHNVLFQMLNHVHKTVGALIQGGKWSRESLLCAIAYLAENEETWMLNMVGKKYKRQYVPARGTDWEGEVDELNKQPLRAFEEASLVSRISRGRDDREAKISLRKNWRDVYRSRYLGAGTAERPVTEQLRGLDWVLQYQTGGVVPFTWFQPWQTTPLWGDIEEWVRGNKDLPTSGGGGEFRPLRSQEQLALVLPKSSYHLVRDAQLQKIPQLAPQQWPSEFQLFTLGRHVLWECEAVLPILTPERLRYFLSPSSEPLK